MYGVQQPTSLPKIADSWVYAELYNEAAVNSGRAAKFTPEQIAQFRNGGPNVNWVKELYHRNSPQSSHNVSMTGGNDHRNLLNISRIQIGERSFNSVNNHQRIIVVHCIQTTDINRR